MNNLELLKYSKRNPEQHLDKDYMFVDEHKDLKKYILQVQAIKSLLINIKKAYAANKSKKALDILYADLGKILNKKYSNFSEFSAFINAADSSLKHAKKDLKLLRSITEIYLKKRRLNNSVPLEWIQALIDKSSSRMKGHAGENKLIKILSQRRYVYTQRYNEFIQQKKAVAKFQSKGDFSLANVKKNFKIEIGKNNQGKKLDLVVKNGKQVYFLEAKHMSNAGGEQSKQVYELIEIIRTKTVNSTHHFVSFLDGIYFNLLWKDPRNIDETFIEAGKDEHEDVQEVITKIKSQAKDITTALSKNSANYFLNTAGFKKLFI